MKTINESKARTISEYQGKPLTAYKAVSEGKVALNSSNELEYSPEYSEYETPQEVKDAGEWPNDKDILDMVNTKAKTAAVAKAYQAAIAPLKAEYDNSPEKARADFIKSAMNAPGMTLDKANAIADSVGFKAA